jgi:hypothetical protein
MVRERADAQRVSIERASTEEEPGMRRTVRGREFAEAAG